LFGSDYKLFSLGFLDLSVLHISPRPLGLIFQELFKLMKVKFHQPLMNITSKFFSFNVWEWFLHCSVLERTESDLLKINWLCFVILLILIVLVPWGKFSLYHSPIKSISAFRDHILILIVGCVTTWFRDSHHKLKI
jgi:hypothetical protein